MRQSAGERARIERDLGIALDDVDLAALTRAKARGVAWEELVEEVLVHETWFFRDPAAFEALRAFARERGGALRVLSAPCSTGEEAYSCAIALREAGLSLEACTILGVDVSDRALARAEAARYAATSFRSTYTGWESDALEPADAEGAREVSPELRDAVRFRKVNLITESALEDEAPFDVVLCRNLIVYLTMDARRRIGRVISRMVAPGGLLFLGHAEELPGFERSGSASALAFRAASSVLRAPRDALVEAQRAYVPPTAIVPAAPLASPLEVARALADRGSLDEAIAHAERAVRDAVDLRGGAEAYALLGTIESARGRAEDALRAWQRAVYLDASHEVAAVSLATALRARGETGRADALVEALARARHG